MPEASEIHVNLGGNPWEAPCRWQTGTRSCRPFAAARRVGGRQRVNLRPWDARLVRTVKEIFLISIFVRFLLQLVSHLLSLLLFRVALISRPA
jgi:hypothetical protein